MPARHSGIDIRQAIDSESIDDIREWCRHGDVNRARLDRMPLIHYACRRGRPASVRALHEAGADPNRLDAWYHTAMSVASWFGEVRYGWYSPESQEIIAFLESVGGRYGRPEDVPFWHRDVLSFFRRRREAASAGAGRRKDQRVSANDADLATAARAAGPAARTVAVAAAERAIADNGISTPDVSAAIACLKRDDLPGALAQREALEQTLARLDGEYFDLDAAEPRDDDAVMRAFRKARAVNAVCAALAADPAVAATEAIYEAYYALPEDRASTFLHDMTGRLRACSFRA